MRKLCFGLFAVAHIIVAVADLGFTAHRWLEIGRMGGKFEDDRGGGWEACVIWGPGELFMDWGIQLPDRRLAAFLSQDMGVWGR